jgi:Protein of unknown function (DUF3822)
MSKNPLATSMITLQGNKISLTPEFYFQLTEHSDEDSRVLHVANKGRLIIHDLTNLPYKLAFVYRADASNPLEEIPNIKHIVEYIPAILQHLPLKVVTNVCLFLAADKAVLFIVRLQEILYVKLHSYFSPDDLLFHLMNGIKLTQLEPENIHLTLCGEIASDSAIMNHLSRYFTNVSCLPLSLDTL